jgi:hypothetical protein
VDLCVLSPRDPAVPESFAGVLYDLDYLPESRRQEILADLLAGPPPPGKHFALALLRIV